MRLDKNLEDLIESLIEISLEAAQVPGGNPSPWRQPKFLEAVRVPGGSPNPWRRPQSPEAAPVPGGGLSPYSILICTAEKKGMKNHSGGGQY